MEITIIAIRREVKGVFIILGRKICKLLKKVKSCFKLVFRKLTEILKENVVKKFK